MPRKWFDALLYQVSSERVEQLLACLQQGGQTKQAHGLFARLAAMPPAVRVALHLKSALTSLSVREIESAVDTLSDEETAALALLDRQGPTILQRETAHALLGIPERFQVVSTWGVAFRALRRRG